MADISIFREGALLGGARALKVMLDGVEAARIRQGQTVTLSASAGEHTVRCAIDFWCGSRTFVLQLNENDTVALICKVRPSLKPSDLLNGVTFGHNDYIEFRRE